MLREELSRSEYHDRKFTNEYLLKVIEAMRPRVSFIKEFIENGFYFFEPPSQYDPEIVKKRWEDETPTLLSKLIDDFSKLSNPQKEDFEKTLHATAERLGTSNGKLIHGVRLAVTGVGGGPGLFEILEILGKEEVVQRIYKAIQTIKPPSEKVN
jgi:glutamyl-tRNA synthetase